MNETRNKYIIQDKEMKSMRIATLAIAASALMLGFTQCTTKPVTQPVEQTVSEAATGLKVAYVDVDTLLTSYDFWVSVNEEMINKRENITASLNKEAAALQKEMEQFQSKVNHNAFASQERAESEYNRIMKKQADLQAKQERLTNEFAAESSKNDMIIGDSIQSFLKAYSKEKGYDIILNSASCLFIDNVMNITQEVVNGLNARYGSAAK